MELMEAAALESAMSVVVAVVTVTIPTVAACVAVSDNMDRIQGAYTRMTSKRKAKTSGMKDEGSDYQLFQPRTGQIHKRA